jgi:iron complex outermembrane receptor protein
VLGYYNDIKKRFNYSVFSYPYNSQVYYSFNPASPTSPDNQTTLYSQRGGVNLTIDTPLDRILPGAKFTWGGDLIQEKTWQTLTSGQDVFTPLKQTTTAAFGQLQIPIGERITLRGGLRYEHFSLWMSMTMSARPPTPRSPPTMPRASRAFVLPALNVTGGEFDYLGLDRQSRRHGQALREQRDLRRLLAGLRPAGCRRLHPARRHLDRLRLPGRERRTACRPTGAASATARSRPKRRS